MNSLEIVNRQIHLLETELKSGVGCIECLKSNLDDWYEIKQDLEKYEILKDKFDVYPIEDDEGNIYYCLDLNSRDGFFEITEEQYKLLSKVGDRQ